MKRVFTLILAVLLYLMQPVEMLNFAIAQESEIVENDIVVDSESVESNIESSEVEIQLEDDAGERGLSENDKLDENNVTILEEEIQTENVEQGSVDEYSEGENLDTDLSENDKLDENNGTILEEETQTENVEQSSMDEIIKGQVIINPKKTENGEGLENLEEILEIESSGDEFDVVNEIMEEVHKQIASDGIIFSKISCEVISLEEENQKWKCDIESEIENYYDVVLTVTVPDGLFSVGTTFIVTPTQSDNAEESLEIFEELTENGEILNAEITEMVYNKEEIKGTSTYDGVTVNVVAPIGSFPEGTILRITPIDSEEEKEEIEKLIEKDVRVSVSFDISFLDKETGVEISPLTGKNIEVVFNYECNEEFVLMSNVDMTVYHIDDKVEEGGELIAKEVEIISNKQSELKIEADSFSIYTLLGANVITIEPGVARDSEEGIVTITDGIRGITISDKNVGATNVNDKGSYFQRGGTSEIAQSIVGSPGQAKKAVTSYKDNGGWTNPGEVSLCGEGYHIPTAEEWENVLLMLDSLGITTASQKATELKIPFAGGFDAQGRMNTTTAYLWSKSSVDNNSANFLSINSSSANVDSGQKGLIISLRCFKNPQTFTVTFDSDGGTEIGDVEVVEWNVVSKPADPIKEGYEFLGWYLSGVLRDFNTNVVAEDLTLYAKWFKEGENYLAIEAPDLIEAQTIIHSQSYNQDVTLVGGYFKVLDFLGSDDGWYTTLQATNLVGDNGQYIDKSNIYIKSSGVTVLSGDNNDRVVLNSDLSDYVSLATTVDYISRATGTNNRKMGIYGTIPEIKVNVPANQLAGTYTGTLIFTIYEN